MLPSFNNHVSGGALTSIFSTKLRDQKSKSQKYTLNKWSDEKYDIGEDMFEMFRPEEK
jgi:hypothetical protein